MAEIDLDQAEADMLFALEKMKATQDEIQFPNSGGRVSIPLLSLDKKESFAIDVTRSQIKLLKATYQNRARQAIILRRLDMDGPPHRNPDGEEIPCPHLHIYREQFGDKWAIPAPSNTFSNTADLHLTFNEFLTFCNVTQPPTIQWGLF